MNCVFEVIYGIDIKCSVLPAYYQQVLYQTHIGNSGIHLAYGAGNYYLFILFNYPRNSQNSSLAGPKEIPEFRIFHKETIGDNWLFIF